MKLSQYFLVNEENITSSPRYFVLWGLREDGTLPRNGSLNLREWARIWWPTPVLLQKQQKSWLIVSFCLPGWISGVIRRAALCPPFMVAKLALGKLQLGTWAQHLSQPGSTTWSPRTPGHPTVSPWRSAGGFRALVLAVLRHNKFQSLTGPSRGNGEIFSQFWIALFYFPQAFPCFAD